MRHFLLVLALAVGFAGTARAQADVPSTSSALALSNGQEIALFATPALATVGGIVFIARADAAGAALALPLVSAAAVCAAGSAASIGGRCSQAFKAAALWSLPGYALVGAGLSMRNWDGIALAGLGGLWMTIAAPIAAVEGYRQSAERPTLSVAPAVVADPATHRAALGAHLRVGL